jgi:hypothetical protein
VSCVCEPEHARGRQSFTAWTGSQGKLEEVVGVILKPMDGNQRRPEMRIAYSSPFALNFSLARVERGPNGWVDWRFNVRIAIRHPTGQFTYDAHDMFFELSSFETFLEQLQGIRSGREAIAKLANPGEMLSLVLRLDGRKLHSLIKISECQPNDPLTTLNASFDVDYDLFVNKLAQEMKEFIAGLRRASPENVGT